MGLFFVISLYMLHLEGIWQVCVVRRTSYKEGFSGRFDIKFDYLER